MLQLTADGSCRISPSPSATRLRQRLRRERRISKLGPGPSRMLAQHRRRSSAAAASWPAGARLRNPWRVREHYPPPLSGLLEDIYPPDGRFSPIPHPEVHQRLVAFVVIRRDAELHQSTVRVSLLEDRPICFESIGSLATYQLSRSSQCRHAWWNRQTCDNSWRAVLLLQSLQELRCNPPLLRDRAERNSASRNGLRSRRPVRSVGCGGMTGVRRLSRGLTDAALSTL